MPLIERFDRRNDLPEISRSFGLSAIEAIGPRFVQVLVAIVLARLLEPEDFGLMGMLALFIALSHMFVNWGLKASLSQSGKITADDETRVLRALGWSFFGRVTLSGLPMG